MNTLDNLLDKTFAYGIDWTEYKDKSEHDHDTSMFAAKIKAQHKEALKASLIDYIESLIPEKYTPAEMMAGVDDSADYREGYNQAIDTMRAKLKGKE
jgi:hypothetical protein